MMQAKMKAILWLWLLKSLNPCLAGRGSFWDGDCHGGTSTFARLGRFHLTTGASWKKKRISKSYLQESYGLELTPAIQKSQNRDDSIWGVNRPVSLRVRRSSKSDQQTTAEEKTSSELTVSISSPIIPAEAWEEMTGEEFEDPNIVDRLARSGFDMCTQEGSNNQFIDFTPHKDTEKLLRDQDMMSVLDQGEVLVYVGKSKKEGQGSHLPIIKTKSILPLSAEEMADVLMDSSRVKIYNKLSLGREDVRLLGENTKIVRNLTKPPVAKSKMVSVTLMHSQQLQEEEQKRLGDDCKEGYLVVSRAVPGMIDEDLADLPRNDILLGVNLLQDISPNECLMTAVTHVYSPALPTMLARSMGVSSAINFVKDIRRAFSPVAN